MRATCTHNQASLTIILVSPPLVKLPIPRAACSLSLAAPPKIAHRCGVALAPASVQAFYYLSQHGHSSWESGRKTSRQLTTMLVPS